MQSRSNRRPWTKIATVCTLAVATGVVAFRAQADLWDKRTVLTVNQPIQIMDTYLDPGTYVLKLADSNSDRHIVQIFSADQKHIINTVLAIPNYRLQPTGDSRFAFWETPPGRAQALRAWFYPGDNFGQEFPYPKNLRQVSVTTVAFHQEPPPPTPAPEPQAAATPEPAPEPAPQALNKESVPEPAPVEVAQAEPPAPAPPPQVASAPEPTTPAEELPKTSTPYPLIGLGGLLSLAAYGLVRLRRLA